ncbi:MAG: RHS repeat-associated core domain-containing protein [Deltaproteobacteria bacterium]|nr:RHS repeat-associated core domain-containing protein [Deltaproteobacteria bacterium]
MKGYSGLVLAILLLAPAASIAEEVPERGPHEGSGVPQAEGSSGTASVSPTGKYSTSIPLGLPSPRGGLPLPLSVVYTGSGAAGAAGVGWDIPLSFVRRSTTLSGRKPSTAWNSDEPRADERVELHLAGSTALMRKLTSPDPRRRVYRPIVASEYIQLTEWLHDDESYWELNDSRGRRYLFNMIDRLGDYSAWYLSRIEDKHGNQIVFSYTVVEQVRTTEWVKGSIEPKELLLSEVSYSFSSGGCPKHVVMLRYAPENHPLTGGVLGYSVHDGHLRVRTQILRAIDLWANASAACNDRQLVKTLSFSYAPDVDTTLPRLVGVTLHGRSQDGGAAPQIPVAQFEYGAIKQSDSIRFQPFQAIPLPSLPEKLRDSITVEHTRVDFDAKSTKSGTMSGLFDLTGDGVVDFVFPADLSADFRTGKGISLLRNIPAGKSGRAWADAKPLYEQGSIAVPPGGMSRSEADSGFGAGYSDVWWELIDWNGDGRLDIVDALNSPNADTWRVYLNTPRWDGREIVWKVEDFDVSAIRRAVQEGHNLRYEHRHPLGTGHVHNDSGRLPLARYDSLHKTVRSYCFDYVPDPLGGVIRLACDGLRILGWEGLEKVNEWSWTVAYWRVLDVNGDKFPDFVYTSKRQAPTYNSAPLDMITEYRCQACPTHVNAGTELPPWCQNCQDVLENELPGDTELRVFYHRGALRRVVAGPPVALKKDGKCGVERWRNASRRSLWKRVEPTNKNEWRFQQCGFADANGDGLLDYIQPTAESGNFTVALLNTGIPAEYQAGGSRTGVTGGHENFTKRLQIPGRVSLVQDHGDFCRDPDGGFINRGRKYTERMLSALIDLTADGIPDFVYWGTRSAPIDWGPESVGNVGWFVRVGTGATFGPPVPIQMPNGHEFDLRLEEKQCPLEDQDQFTVRVLAALRDIDGDGRQEVLRAENGQLNAASLVSASGRLGAHEAGQIVRAGNGYGGWTRIEYVSAKQDGATPHQLPFPEIVVARTRTETDKGLSQGEQLAQVSYAYGEGRMQYSPLREGWAFPGYGRHVVLHGKPTSHGAAQLVEGTATIYDAIRPGEIAQGGYLKHALTGRTRDIRRFDGTFNADPWALLELAPLQDSRWHGNAHLDYATKEKLDTSVELIGECWDVTDPYSAIPVYPFHLCQQTGLVYTSKSTEWRGQRPWPSLESVATESTVIEVDEWGRPKLVFLEGDLRDDSELSDDKCLRLTYADPSDAADGRPYLDAMSSMRTVGCAPDHTNQERLLSGVRYVYDKLPEGKVDKGLVTKVIVEVYKPHTGEKLREFVAEERDYYPNGNLKSVRRERSNPAERGPKVELTTAVYDDFGLVPEWVSRSASDVAATLETFASYDSATLLPELVTDPNGVQVQIIYDGLGREKERRLIDPDTAGTFLLSTKRYDDDPIDPRGRRHTDRLYTRWIAPGEENVSPADGQAAWIELTTFLDELGRVRYRERPLGKDYGNDSLISDYVEFDWAGRTRFAALPFEKSWSKGKYGETNLYRPDGRLLCSVLGEGLQPRAYTDIEKDLYPTCHEYKYENGREVVETRGPSELHPSSPHYQAFDVARTSATGVLLDVSRWKGGQRLEHAEYRYDPLDQLSTVKRFADPVNRGGPAVWSFVNDSLGRTLEIAEPATSTRFREYDEWGNVIKESWQDTSPSQARVSSTMFDGFGRPTRVTVSRPSDGTQREESAAYEYDTPRDEALQGRTGFLGRLSKATDGLQEAYFTYDRAGNVRKTTWRNSGDGRLVRQAADSGPAGHLLELGFARPFQDDINERARYEYDSAARLRNVTWTSGGEPSRLFATRNIDKLGRYLEVAQGNGAVSKKAYRQERRRELLRQELVFKEGVYRSYFEQFDAAGRLLKRRDEVVGPARGAAVESRDDITVNTYDVLGRLDSAKTFQRQATSAVSLWEKYSYDGLGNLLKVEDLVGTGTRLLSPSNADPDRLCTIEWPKRNAAPSPSGGSAGSSSGRSGGFSRTMIGGLVGLDSVLPRIPRGVVENPAAQSCAYRYDGAGNVVEIKDADGPPRKFEYDSSSRITRLTKGEIRGEIAYDAFGGVASVNIAQGRTVLRNDRRFGPLVELAGYSAVGSVGGSNGMSSTYFERRIPGPDGLIVAIRTGDAGTRHVYPYSDQTAMRVGTNRHGAAVQEVAYTPFGSITKDTGQEGSAEYTKYLWNGGDSYKAFGLFHMGARAYEPITGRFVHRDPLMVARTSSRMHPYSFAHNDPVNFTDPSGLDPGGAVAQEEDWEDPPMTSSLPVAIGPLEGSIGNTTFVTYPSQYTTVVTVHLSVLEKVGRFLDQAYASFVAINSSPNIGLPIQDSPGVLDMVGDMFGAAIDIGAAFVTELVRPDEFDVSLLAAGGTAALMDGPLPIGDIGLVGAAAYVGGRRLFKAFGALAGAARAGRRTVAATGAFLPGAMGGSGLGKVARMSIRVSEKGLLMVERHLAQFGNVPTNTAMVERLRDALSSGRRITDADASFYLHEIAEATMMGRGAAYEAAHAAALGKYLVSPFSVYHPAVISALPGYFNLAWRAFWGLE